MSAPTNDPAIVSLPKTPTRRGAHAYVILVERVNLDPKTPDGLAIEGVRYRPGMLVSFDAFADAQPNAESPLVVEFTEVENLKGARKLWTLLVILWRWESSLKEWVEVSRYLPPSSWEAYELRQLVARMLRQEQWRKLESLSDSAQRISTYLSIELAQVPPDRAGPVLELVIHHLVGRIVERNGYLDLYRKPAGLQGQLPFQGRLKA